MRLGKKQELFSRLECQIVPEANRQGMEVRGGEYQRMEQQARWNATHCGKCKLTKNGGNHGKVKPKHPFKAIGIVMSVHRLKLAKDVILVKNGRVTWKRSDYVKLGVWWEGLHPMCRWGGRFRDPGHFSLEHQGRR